MAANTAELHEFIKEIEDGGYQERAHRILTHFDDIPIEEAQQLRAEFNNRIDQALANAGLRHEAAEIAHSLVDIAIRRRADDKPASPWDDLYLVSFESPDDERA
jgi:hypothetical protein